MLLCAPQASMPRVPMNTVARVLLACALVPSSTLFAQAPAGLLTLHVHGLSKAEGQVCVALFNSEQGFPGESKNALRSLCVQASGVGTDGSLSIALNHLPVGRIAAAVFHDANGDGKLNTGLFGIPNEDFGFTGNPVVRVGAPSFHECSLALGTHGLETGITLKSFRLLGGANRPPRAQR